MNLPNEAPQGTEPVVFRTEDERTKAIQDMPEAPPEDVVDRDKWNNEQDETLDRYSEATIDPNYNPESAAAVADAPTPTPGENDWYKAEDWTVTFKGETTVLGPDEITDEMKKSNFSGAKELMFDYLSSKNLANTREQEFSTTTARLETEISETNNRLTETMAQLEETKKELKESGVTVKEQVDADMPDVKEVTRIQTELTGLTEQLERLDDEDLENIPVQKKIIKLNMKLSSMNQRISDARFKKFDDAEKGRVEDANKAKVERDRLKAEGKQREESQKQAVEMSSSIEKFTTDIPELKMSKSFDDVDDDYVKWGPEVAATYFGISKDKVTGAQVEMAVGQFLNKTPALIQKLTEQGKLNMTPPDLQKYLITTELYWMTKGREIDSATGQWKQCDWRMPDMQAAHDRWKRKNGLAQQDLVKAMNSAEDQIIDAMNPQGIAEQPGPKDGQNKELTPGAMTKEEAQLIYNKLEKEGRNSGYQDVDEYIGSLQRVSETDERVIAYDKAFDVLYEGAPKS